MYVCVNGVCACVCVCECVNMGHVTVEYAHISWYQQGYSF